jgi:hypothetical protein
LEFTGEKRLSFSTFSLSIPQSFITFELDKMKDKGVNE